MTWTLIHSGQVTPTCNGNLTNIGSDNGLSPCRHRAIIWTNAGMLSVEPLGTNFSENLIKILTFSFKKMHLKMLSGKWWPFCLSLNVLTLFFRARLYAIFCLSPLFPHKLHCSLLHFYFCPCICVECCMHHSWSHGKPGICCIVFYGRRGSLEICEENVWSVNCFYHGHILFNMQIAFLWVSNMLVNLSCLCTHRSKFLPHSP